MLWILSSRLCDVHVFFFFPSQTRFPPPGPPQQPHLPSQQQLQQQQQQQQPPHHHLQQQQQQQMMGTGGKALKSHQFLIRTFSSPLKCNHCTSLMVGLTRQGVVCEVCGFACHIQCREKVPLSCPVPPDQSKCIPQAARAVSKLMQTRR